MTAANLRCAWRSAIPTEMWEVLLPDGAHQFGMLEEASA